MNPDFYFLNGEEVSVGDISKKLFSSALFYGTGCFETMRFENNHICRFDDHISRLHSGLDYLQLPIHLIPEKEFLREKITHLVHENGIDGKAVKIRVQCSLIENNGYHLDPKVELLTHIRVSTIHDNDKAVRLLTVKTRVIPSECRPSGLKLSNMLHYRSAFREALTENYDDALMLTLDGFIAETSVGNLFWANGNRVFTPSEECSILSGIMRKSSIHAIKTSGKLNIEEGKYQKDSILEADLVWLSNSVVEFRPVMSIDDVMLNCDENLLKEITSTIHDSRMKNSNL